MASVTLPEYKRNIEVVPNEQQLGVVVDGTRGRGGEGMVTWFTTYAISAYHH